ncbi:unnamed protein product [Urochloa humidicola]
MGTPHALLCCYLAAALFWGCRVTAAGDSLAWICGSSGNFTPNSMYQRSLQRVAKTLPQTSALSGFATATIGAVPDAVFAAALCRRDTTASACRECVAAAFLDGLQTCLYHKDATVFLDVCVVRYSNTNLVASASITGEFNSFTSNDTVPASSEHFDAGVEALLETVIDYAATSESRYGTGTGSTDTNGNRRPTYALAQCQPTMAPEECRGCLSYMLSMKPSSFSGKRDGSMRRWRCFFQFDDYHFFTGDSIIHPQTPSGRRKRHRKVGIVVAVAVTVFTVTLAVFLIIRTRRKRARKEGLPLHGQAQSQNGSKIEAALKLWRTEESSPEFTHYEFSELVAATASFSDENWLGSGGFGPVYKGKLRSGAEVAVKRLSSRSNQGLEQFKTEVQLLVKLQHTNLVRLVGCCINDKEKLLVYEYMPNGSLDRFIFDQQGPLLDWYQRLQIMEGIAEGMLYLHKHSRVRVIHRDLKASNILLDKDFNPRISDFGLAIIFQSNMMESNSNRIVGTYGYMAPEYTSTGTFSVKTDVYSFGVLLLEMISGRRNNSPDDNNGCINMLEHAWQLWREGRESELIDLRLGVCGEVANIVRCIKVALLCVQDSATDRPTMADVLAMLAARDGAASLPVPKLPQQLSSSGLLEMQTHMYPSTCSVNDVSITTMQGR